MASIKVNGTKTISDLAAVTAINDADVFLIEVGGVTKKVTGATLKSLIASETPAVDNTLSITGAAADAKATGDAILSAQGVVANEFDDTETYDVGDYVRYEGKLYKFTAAHEVGDFDQNEVAEVIIVEEMVKDIQVNGTSVVSQGIASITITEVQTVQVSGTTPVITANQNTRYVCGEVATLDFTPSASGICDVIFSSGSTATVLTLPNTVILPSWFDATALEANTTYEISISDGIYGAVMVW